MRTFSLHKHEVDKKLYVKNRIIEGCIEDIGFYFSYINGISGSTQVKYFDFAHHANSF